MLTVQFYFRSIGKVCMVLIPLMFMLLVSLTIRACIAPGGMQVMFNAPRGIIVGKTTIKAYLC